MKLLRLIYIIAMVVFGLNIYDSIKTDNSSGLSGWSSSAILATSLLIVVEIKTKKI